MRINFLGKILLKIKNCSPKKAFSLNDLSMMIATVAVVGATTVAINEIKNSNNKTESDTVKLERIYSAIGRFLVDNKKLPCPARLNVAKGSGINYGKEYKNADDTCATGNGVFKTSSDNNILYGAVPAQSLGLKSDDIEDQYGSKIVYVVHISGTQIPSVNASAPVTTSITITENEKEISSNALFVLIASGRNKEGAFNAKSTVQNPITTSSISETQNVATAGTTTVTSGGTTTTVVAEDVIAIDNVFVKGTKTDSKFDDKVFFKEKSEIVKDFNAEFLISCPALPVTYGSKTGYKDQIVYANFTCTGSTKKRPAKKCGDNGDWITEASCPCLISSIPGVSQTDISVPNGDGTIKCDQEDYSGSLKYNCLETGSLSIIEVCKKSCNFALNNSITGVRPIKLLHGSNLVNCDVAGYKGKIVANCNDGVIESQIGTCNDSRCNVPASSGMKELLNIPSGTSSTSGICDTNYSGSYSYTCEDGSITISDNCFKNCSFDLIGAKSTPILTHGNYVIPCDVGYQGNGVSLTCNDGSLTVKSNNCAKYNKCTVGLDAGMVQKEVEVSDIILNDGACKVGYSGSYSYKCTPTGPTNVVNNCVPSTCEVGNAVGLVNKVVNRGTSGVNGECSSGFGGYYKWSCNSNGVGSVTENNCKSTCDVGGTNGMLNYVVSYGKTGDGVCNTSQGYIGTFSWSCELNATTGLVEGKITVNNCKNSCIVGSSSQGSGLVQKTVPLNTNGNDGLCNTVAGYVGSYSWSCDILGGSKITSYCKNSCDVGTSTGMVKQTVALNTTGSGQCDSAIGYTGTYSYTCSSLAIPSITQNNCVLRTCIVGGSSTGMNERTINAGISISNGTCQAGFVGSYSASCSFAGVATVSNNCLPIKCPISSANYPNLASYNDLNYATNPTSISCLAGNYGDIKYTCIANGASTTGNLSVTGSCTPITCTTSASVIGFTSGTIIPYSSTAQSYFCNDPIYDNLLTASFICTTQGSSISYSTNNCAKISCTIPNTWNTTLDNSSVNIASNQSLTCKTGFTGSPTYTCSATTKVRPADGLSVPSTPGVITQGGTACSAITCSILAGTGYGAKSGLAYSAGTLSIPCDATGYTGSVLYNCTATGTATLVAGQSCTPITCSASGTGFNARSNLAYSTGSGTIACDATGYTGSVNYTCTTNLATATISGSCTPITCTTSVAGFTAGTIIPYSTTAQPYYCNDPIYDNLLTASFICSTPTSSISHSTNNCIKISCTIPNTWNTTLDNSSVNIASNQSLTCKTGFTGSPTYTCSATTKVRPADSLSVPSTPGVITQGGTACSAITCSLSAGTGYGAKSGLAYSENFSKSFSCDIPGYTGTINYSCISSGTSSTGVITTSGTCTAITCSAPAGTGYNSKTLSYGSGSFDCDLFGYSGTISYSCSEQNNYSLTGSCSLIKCSIPSNFYSTIDSFFVNATSSAIGMTCITGYTGSPSYECFGDKVVLYANPSYSGPSISYGVGSFDIGTISIGNDTVSSIQVPSGYRLTLYQHSAYSGYASKYTSSQGVLIYSENSTISFDNITSSLKVEKLNNLNSTGAIRLINSCTPITCSASGTGFNSRSNLAYSTGSGTIACDATGYTGSVNYTCTTNLATATISGSCTPITCTTSVAGFTAGTIIPYSTTAQPYYCNDPIYDNLLTASFICSTPTSSISYSTNNCAKISCTIPNTWNTTLDNSSVNIASNQSLTCKTGFTGSPTYTCSATTKVRPADGLSVPSTPGVITQGGTACSAITCSLSASNGYGVQSSLAYTAITGSGVIACNASVAYSGYANYTCQTSGVATITKTCDCATGYAKDASGACIAITCIAPSGITGFAQGTTGIAFGTANYYCNAPGYYSTNTITFTCSANGTSTTGSLTYSNNNCTAIPCTISGTGYVNKSVSGSSSFACDPGYTGNVSYTCTGATTATISSNTCAIINCPISAGFGYSSRNVSGSSSFACDAGYAGTINYTCTSSTTANISGSCSAIKCSSTAYNGLSSSVLTNLAYTGSATGTVNCDQTGYTGTASYQCTGTTNPGTFTLTSGCSCASGYEVTNVITGVCGQTQCNTSIAGFQTNTPIPYSTTSQNYYCNDPLYDNFSTTSFPACTASQPLSPTSTCVKISCSTASLNVTQSSIFLGANQALTCSQGYYSATGVTATCSTVYANRTVSGVTTSVPSSGSLSTTGTCGRIKCTIPANSNLTIADGTEVDFTTTSTPLTCKTGFASSLGATAPSYTCTGSTSLTGTYTQSGSCGAITCSILAGTGYTTKSNLAYSAGTLSIPCDATGYTGSVFYNCTATGNATLVAGQSCTPITCSASGTGFNARSGLPYSTGTGTITCDSNGYNGTVNYTCTTNLATATISGSCTPITCALPSLTGFTGRSVNLGSTSLTCDQGFSGGLYYACGCKKSRIITNENGTETLKSNQLNQIFYFWTPEKPSKLISFSHTASGSPNNSNWGNLLAFNEGNKFFQVGYQYSTAAWRETDMTSYNQFFKANTSGSYFQWTTFVANYYFSVYTRSDNAGVFRINVEEYDANATCASSSLYYSNTCTAISCTISGTGYTNKPLSGVGTFPCDAGYSGTISYTCTGATTATTTGTCTPISCTISGTGYTNKSVSGSSSFACDAGYTGTISYACTGATTATTTGTCTPITCSVAGLNISATNNLLNYATTATNISCATGYTPANNAQLTYTCTGSSNPGVLSVSSTCVSTTCTVGGTNGTTSTVVNRNTTGNGVCATNYSGYFSYKCDANSVGSITVNNCYTGRTFVEKTFSFSIPQQSSYIGPGGWGWGFEYPFTLSTPVDYEYATKVNYNFSSTYNCSTYGSYMNPGLTKKSGFGSIGTLVGGYFEPAPCSGCTISYTPGIQNIVGVDVKNNDSLAFYLSGYTGCGYVYPNYSGTITYMANPSCIVGGSSGMLSQTILGGSSGTNGTCQTGYSGSYSWSCGINGQGSVSANTCTAITCSIPNGTGYTTKSNLAYSTGNLSIPCDATGYSGSVFYNCTAIGTATLVAGQSCTPITCTVPALNTTLDNTSVNYTVTSTALTCKAGYSGSPTYTCTGTSNPGTFASAGTTCSPITCAISAGTGYSGRTLNYGSGTFTCNGAGYTGTISYNCNAVNTPNLSGTCTAVSNTFTPNWYDSASAPAGVYVTTSSSNSIGLAGPNNAPAGSWGYYLANLPSWVTKVSFNWTYSANDYGDYDRGYFFINGGWQYLANNNCTGCSSSGTITNFAITNTTDRRFGPGVWTSDGCCGAGFLTLSNIVFQ